MRTRILLSLLLCVTGLIQARDVSDLYRLAREAVSHGELPQAIDCFEEIFQTLPASRVFDDDRVAYARPYSNLLLLAGRYEDVENLLADSIYTDDVSLQINRAAGLGYMQKYDEASRLLENLLNNGVTTEYEGRIHQNLGFMALEKREYGEAATRLQLAADRMEGLDREIARSNLALALGHQGEYAEALKIIDSALKMMKAGGTASHRDYLKALRKKAEILQLKGDKKQASAVYREYFRLEKEWLGSNLKGMGKNARIALWNSEKDLLSKCFSLEDEGDFLYEVAMYRRLTSLLGMQDMEALSRLLTVTPSRLAKTLKVDEAALEFITYTDLYGKERYAAVMLAKNGKARFIPLFAEDYIYNPDKIEGQSIFDLIQSDRPKEKNLLYNSREIADEVWQPIMKVLPKGVRRLYFAPEGVFHLWGIENMPFKGRENLEIKRLSSTALLADLQKKRTDEGKMLLIGGLDYSSLPDSERDCKDTHPASAPNQEAARVLTERAGRVNLFSYLPGTRTEVDSIKRIAPEAALRYSESESSLKNEMPAYDMIHIATHGYTLAMGVRRRPQFGADRIAVDDIVCLTDTAGFDESLLACGIALSGANVSSLHPELEDGLLSAREMSDLDLTGVDFVVLSACQTAQGSVVDEGAAGMLRGLKNAGVGSVMVSLWSVDDTSTMLFMTEFYRQLNAGKSRSEAYAKAQEYLKNHVKRISKRNFSAAKLASEKSDKTIEIRYEDPYYWAPFILIDDI